MEKREKRFLTMPKNQMIYGRRPVIEAIREGKSIDKIFIQQKIKGDLATDLFAEIKRANLHFNSVPAEKLNRITKKNHQGVVAFMAAIEFSSLEHIIDQAFGQGRQVLLLVLDGITDVRNFGAIIRSAEGAGVDAIIVPVKGSAQISADAMKTSAGALNMVPVCRSNNLLKEIELLKQSGINIIACTEKSDQLIYHATFDTPAAIIMGSEEKGISKEILALSDQMVKIPMRGKIKSLNVASSAGIILYEALRQRL